MNENNSNPNPNPAPTSPAPEMQTPEAVVAPEATTTSEFTTTSEPVTIPETATTSEPAPAPAPESDTDDPDAQTTKGPDEALVEAYVGDNYDKISKRIFNIPAFFFPGLYMIFRKKYLWGILIIIVSLFLQNLVTIFAYIMSDGYLIIEMFFSIGMLGINLGSAFFFNKFYIKSIHKKIDKLRAQHPGITNDELKGICSSKGGTSIPGLIVSILVMIVISIISFTIISVVIMSQVFTSSMQNTDVSVSDNGTVHISGGTSSNSAGSNNVYNGALSYSSDYDYEDLIDITVPKAFTLSDISASFGYQYEPEDGYGSCSMKINVVDNFTDPAKMIESMAEYFDEDIIEPSGVYKKNGLTWNYLGTEDVFGEEYRFAIDVNGNIIYIEYEMDEELYDVCEEYLWEAIDSVKAK